MFWPRRPHVDERIISSIFICPVFICQWGDGLPTGVGKRWRAISSGFLFEQHSRASCSLCTHIHTHTHQEVKWGKGEWLKAFLLRFFFSFSCASFHPTHLGCTSRHDELGMMRKNQRVFYPDIFIEIGHSSHSRPCSMVKWKSKRTEKKSYASILPFRMQYRVNTILRQTWCHGRRTMIPILKLNETSCNN